MDYRILVLPGDGIGPEVIAEGVKVLEEVGRRFGHRFAFAYDEVGGAAIDKYGVALRSETLDGASQFDAVLFGAVGGPKWDDPAAQVRPEDGILGIRKGLGVFANLRPVKVFPAMLDSSVVKPSVLRDVDIMVVRELTGGLYYARPKGRRKTRRGWTGVDTLRYTQGEIERVLRVGFELARRRRGKLASVDKANVLETSRLWRQIATDLASEYPDVEMEHMLVDTCAMQLMQRPSRFDVIVTENMFGDILSDEASVIIGSLGMLPSASIGEKTSLFEPIHGSFPKAAGKNIANPIGAILSAAMLLEYAFRMQEEAQAIRDAVERSMQEGYVTQDLNDRQHVGSAEAGDWIANAITMQPTAA